MKVTLSIFLLFLIGCYSDHTSKSIIPPNDSLSITTQLPAGLIGRWVKVLPTGKRYIEISGISRILVYKIASNGGISDTLRGNLMFTDSGYSPVEMHFPSLDATFFYRWKQDTLIYVDERGEGEKYIKQH